MFYRIILRLLYYYNIMFSYRVRKSDMNIIGHEEKKYEREIGL